MNKQTKMIIGVGVVAVAGYLIYKQQQKKPAASFSGGAQTGREYINASGTTPSGGLTFTGKPCGKSPANAIVSTLPVAIGSFAQGTPIYECCKSGQFGTALGSTGCKNTAMQQISLLSAD